MSSRRFHRWSALASTLSCGWMALCCAASSVDPDATGALIVGDAMPTALADGGDAARGRALLIAHDDANCILCHAIADPAIRVSGSVGPALDGVGRRLSVGQLRLRVVDMRQVNAASAMPSYYRTAGLDRVADAYRGRPILAAAQVEDVVAYLATLK